MAGGVGSDWSEFGRIQFEATKGVTSSNFPRMRLPNSVCYLVLAVGLFLASLVVKTVLFPGTASGRQAILSAATERLTAQEEAMDYDFRGNTLVSSNLNTAALAWRLEKIDVSKTPADFKVAWLDYVRGWKRKAAYDVKQFARDAGQIIAAQVDPSGLNDISRRMDGRDTVELWHRCRLAAAKAGVDLPP